MNREYTTTISTTPAVGNEAQPRHQVADADAADAADATSASSGGQPPNQGPPNGDQAQQPERGDPPQAARLVALVTNAELFKSPAEEAYATVRVGQHDETHAVRSSPFERHLAI